MPCAKTEKIASKITKEKSKNIRISDGKTGTLDLLIPITNTPLLLLLAYLCPLSLIMPARGTGARSSHASPSSASRHQIFYFEDFQSQLWDLCNEDDSINQMQSLLSDTRNLKMSSEDRTCINVCGLIAPFMISAKAITDSLGTIKQSINKNTKNLRLLAFANEKLEQYTRRDNLRILKFPACADGELGVKFIVLMASILGVEIQVSDISIIHHLPSRTPLKTVIVRFNNRHLRNRLLFAKKQPMNADECPFKGVFIHENLTTQRSKLDWIINGNLRVTPTLNVFTQQ